MKKIVLLTLLIVAMVVIGCEEPKVDVTKVSLNKTELTLMVGDFDTLSATIEPENAMDPSISWESGNPEVAVVNENGKVVAVAPGKAVISAVSKNGVSAKCDVTVSGIEVSELIVEPVSMRLFAGRESTLSVTVLPTNASDQSCTFESTSPSVAVVDKNGKVTAVSAGSTVIKAISKNGKSATCDVLVEPAPASVFYYLSNGSYKDGERLPGTSLYLFDGPDTFYFKILRTVSSYSFQIYKNDTVIKSYDNPTAFWNFGQEIAKHPQSDNYYLFTASKESDSNIWRVVRMGSDGTLMDNLYTISSDTESVYSMGGGFVVNASNQLEFFTQESKKGVISYYKNVIGLDGKVTKSAFSFPSGVNYIRNLAYDKSGNFYLIGGTSTNLTVYKNGKSMISFSTNALSAIKVIGKDVYVSYAVATSSKITVRVFKNFSEIYANDSIPYSGTSVDFGGVDVDAKGDIYYSVGYSGSSPKTYVYQNDRLLYEHDFGRTTRFRVLN